MNIFFVDLDPYEAAKQLVDKHVVKMIVESAQMLSTAHRILDGDEKLVLHDHRNDILYKATHKNHPSAVWARTSVQNYLWLVDHMDGLLQEYTYRYEKTHKTSRLMYPLQSPPYNLRDWDMTPAPSCMPDEFKIGGLVDNYRAYYSTAKSHIHSWKKREVPEWIFSKRLEANTT